MYLLKVVGWSKIFDRPSKSRTRANVHSESGGLVQDIRQTIKK